MNNFKTISSRLLQYFIQGILVLAPIAVTIWVILNIFNWLDQLIPVYINLSGNEKEPFYLPGIGFLIMIAGLIIVGYFSSFFMVSRMLSFFDHLLERTPGVKVIYTFVKDFSEAFAGKKRKFQQPVLVSIYQPDVWQLGFITNQDLSRFELHEHIAVYIPNSYAVAGNLFMVTPTRIKLLDGITATETMKFAISGGVAEVADTEDHSIVH